MDGPDTIETLTWKSIFLNCLQLRSSKLSGMEPQYLSEDSQENKSNKNISIQFKLFWTKVQRLFSLQQVKPAFLSALLFVHIWVVSPSHIWVTTTDTSAFAMVQCMISSEESDKVLHCKICHILTTQSTKMVP